MKPSRVLIFSASFGAGHIKAAEAIAVELEARDPAIEIIHVDFGVFLNRGFYTVLKNTYIEMIKYTPKLYGKFYYRTSKTSPQSAFKRILNRWGRKELLEYLKSVQPDLIVSTYSTVAGVLGHLRECGVLEVPVVTVVTDFAVHTQWIHPGVDQYIAACPDVYDGLVSHGIAAEKIKITGIPVHPKFEKELSRSGQLAKFGLLPDRPTFLIMAGAYGVLGSAKWLVKTIAESEMPVQALVVCGKNEKLYKSLDSIIAQTYHKIVRFGFISNVEELMSAADIVITKAGGLVVSEALTKHLPVLVLKPIPGQEEENAAYLVKIGAGRVANDEEEMKELIVQLLSQPEQLAIMKKAAAAALPGHAAERAAGYMVELMA